MSLRHCINKTCLLLGFALFVVLLLGSVINSNAGELPQTGYQLIIEGDGGTVYVDGIERQSGYITDIPKNTTVKFLAFPDEGYVVHEWTLVKASNGNVTNMGSQNLILPYIMSGFFEVHVSFVQQPCHKLSLKNYCNGVDVTLYDADSQLNLDKGCICEAYLLPSNIPLDEEVLNDIFLYAEMTDISFMFASGLNYYTFDTQDDVRLVFCQDVYPGFSDGIQIPDYVGDGITVSNESMVLMRQIIRSSSNRFEGKEYVVIDLTGDIEISSDIHDAEYTALNIEYDDERGRVSVSPESDLLSCYWIEQTPVTIQAKPSDGYKFVRWENLNGTVVNDANLRTNPFTFILGADSVSIKAIFEPAISSLRPVKILSDPEGKSVIRVNDSTETTFVEEGSEVHLNITIDEYYLFDRWEVYQNGVENQYNLVLPAMQHSTDALFEMPYGEQGVTIKAVLKDRYTSVKTRVSLKNQYGSSSSTDYDAFVDFTVVINGTQMESSQGVIQNGDSIGLSVRVANSDYLLDSIRIIQTTGIDEVVVFSTGNSSTEFIISEWSDYYLDCLLTKKDDEPNDTHVPVLSDGTAERTGPNTAEIVFQSDTAGEYYYSVVETGDIAVIDTSINGCSAVKGINRFSLNTLTDESRDLYIKLKSFEGLESELLKIEIPAYSGDHEGDCYSITISVPIGGSLTISASSAKAGEMIYISVFPNDGYHLADGSVAYTEAVPGGKTIYVNGYSFIMPACDITVSCKWEKDQNGQTDASEQFWNDILNIYTLDPWWKYAEKQSNEGNYPIYW